MCKECQILLGWQTFGLSLCILPPLLQPLLSTLTVSHSPYLILLSHHQASASCDGSIKLWDVRTWRCTHNVSIPRSTTEFSPLSIVPHVYTCVWTCIRGPLLFVVVPEGVSIYSVYMHACVCEGSDCAHSVLLPLVRRHAFHLVCLLLRHRVCVCGGACSCLAECFLLAGAP